jgi:hypothetical protein
MDYISQTGNLRSDPSRVASIMCLHACYNSSRRAILPTVWRRSASILGRILHPLEYRDPGLKVHPLQRGPPDRVTRRGRNKTVLSSAQGRFFGK